LLPYVAENMAVHGEYGLVRVARQEPETSGTACLRLNWTFLMHDQVPQCGLTELHEHDETRWRRSWDSPN